MDACRMGRDAIEEGMRCGGYIITGIINETGEIVVALASEEEKTILRDCTDLRKVNILKKTRARRATEYDQIYCQNVCSDERRHIRNGIRVRKLL